MKSKKMEVTRGSGNVFRDLGYTDADVQQFKAILAAEIIKALDREGLTLRAAHERTGIASQRTELPQNIKCPTLAFHALVYAIRPAFIPSPRENLRKYLTSE